MINTGKFEGKTVFITGGSRGIGKAIALKLAKDGANIAIAAKTAEHNPKLEGTIFTAAKEVEAVGGQCLPIQCDVRDEESVRSAIEKTVQQFGGLDILINNASAISLTGTEQTTMKRFDLMHSVITRATFMTTKYAIPHLKKSSNPHILNVCPPIDMQPKWFESYGAYTLAKYGASLCVYGMAHELKPCAIAVNGIWPRACIWTGAMEFLGGGSAETPPLCRKVDIMADAAYALLSKSSDSFTGNFCLDEDILMDEGIKDLDQYAMKPGSPLLLDFFISEAQTQKGDNVLDISEINLQTTDSKNQNGFFKAKIIKHG